MKSSISENAPEISSSIGGVTMIVLGFLENHGVMIIGVIQFVLTTWFLLRKDRREQDAANAAARIAAQQERLNELEIESKRTAQIVAKLRIQGVERRGNLNPEVHKLVQEAI